MAFSNFETIVVTASRSDAELSTITGSISAVGGDQLELIAPVHVAESLVRVAGVNLARGNGQEYLPALRSPVLTGAGACGEVLTTIDEVPIHAAGFCNINELFSANTEQAERIEVLSGPVSALYGSNALHGVINVITAGVDPEGGGSITLEGGPHDFARVRATQNFLEGDHGMRLDLSAHHDGGYRDASLVDEQKLNLRDEYSTDTLAVTTTVGLINLNQETAGYIEGFEAYKNRSLKRGNLNPEAYRDAWGARIASRIDYQLDSQTKLTLTPYWRHAEMNFLQHFLPGTPVEENGQQSIGLLSAYDITLSSSVRVIAGVDLEYTEAFLKEYQSLPTEGSAFLQATIPVGKHYDYQVDAITVAPFVQSSWTVSSAIQLSLGLRGEYMEYDYDNRMLNGRTDEQGNNCGFGGCRFSRPADRVDRFDNWSPKFGLLYQISSQQQIYLNVSKGFRVPQATELYRLQRDQQVADLKSVEALSAEAGLRGGDENFHYQIAVYDMEKKHVIFRDNDFFNVSNGETGHQGVEVSTDYQFYDNWSVAIAASYARHRYLSNQQLSGINIEDNDIDGAPRHFGSAQLGWQMSEQSKAELEWVHMGRYYTDPENEHQYKGHDVLNLRFKHQFHPSWSLSGRLLNLLDTDYAERADYTSFSGDRYLPGEDRALYLSVDCSW